MNKQIFLPGLLFVIFFLQAGHILILQKRVRAYRAQEAEVLASQVETLSIQTNALEALEFTRDALANYEAAQNQVLTNFTYAWTNRMFATNQILRGWIIIEEEAPQRLPLPRDFNTDVLL